MMRRGPYAFSIALALSFGGCCPDFITDRHSLPRGDGRIAVQVVDTEGHAVSNAPVIVNSNIYAGRFFGIPIQHTWTLDTRSDGKAEVGSLPPATYTVSVDPWRLSSMVKMKPEKHRVTLKNHEAVDLFITHSPVAFIKVDVKWDIDEYNQVIPYVIPWGSADSILWHDAESESTLCQACGEPELAICTESEECKEESASAGLSSFLALPVRLSRWFVRVSIDWVSKGFEADCDHAHGLLRGGRLTPDGTLVPPNPNPQRMLLAGPLLQSWYTALFSFDDLWAAQPGERCETEPIRLRKVGPLQSGFPYDFGEVEDPSWREKSVCFEGHFLDSLGRPVKAVMVLLPKEERNAELEMGAFVVSRSDGAYRVAGLPPGAYDGFVVWRRHDGIYGCQYDFDVECGGKQLDLRVED